MVPIRINIRKINEQKDLGYLEDWYCPLEMCRNGMTGDFAPGDSPATASIDTVPILISRKLPLNRFKKKLSAGFG
ncbi:MAG: hypothetical protein XD97_0297 [Pelotomaculum thermopropionicum]|uniref:Uncharacterized protein n=1 Tax=Pelotomaculum thermopropionicum TaxID=110500 RepID=A0A117M3W7_9FIRM|nr:MAG: hypothetical protein XD97_0297 [Pelotomaculum thermopropionicum]